jgi:2-keto-3-deoxy-L-rhamnonate aldolase RhmA
MQEFRQRVRSGAVLLGTFVKTPSHVVVEVLGRAGLDFAVIDGEHAPFNPETLDRMALAAHAARFPCLLRIPELDSAAVGQALDLGLSGIMVPHAKDAASAEQALAAAKYARSARGFSPSTRAGGYGAGDAAQYRAKADAESSVWCQIEDEDALSRLDEIAAVAEIDCLFLGRADLALSLGVASQKDPKVVEAVAATAAAGRRHGRTVGIYISDTAEIPALLALGITVFVCGSDQSYLIAQARRHRAELSATLAAKG